LTDIFLSYGHGDVAIAKQFAETFEREGFTVWWDATLRSGEAFDSAIETALENAKAVVVLWSKTSVQSRWVRAEATLADRSKTLIPVMIEPCVRPIMFELMHTIDLAHWQGAADDATWLSLLAEMRRFVEERTSGLEMPAERLRPIPRTNDSCSGTDSPVEPQRSIAVLPFTNMSGDKEQEYFSDGLAEEIINALAQISALKVIARTSAFAFKGKNTDIRTIARTLGVTNILEGSVRRSGNRIRVTAQLITATDGTHLWSERYDREMADVFAVQDEISAAISSALQIKLAPQTSATPQHVPALPAYEALLKARHFHWKATAESMDQARVYHEQAIALDPQFALAHAEYADYLMARAYFELSHQDEMAPVTRAVAQKALDLDPSLTDAHGPLCSVAASYDRDWSEANRQFLLATPGGRGSPLSRMNCAWAYLLPSGRPNEAVQQLQLAVQGDPLHVTYRALLGVCLDAAGRHAESESILLQTRDFAPEAVLPALYLTYHYFCRNRLAEALSLAEMLFCSAPWFSMGLVAYAGLLTGMGQAGRGKEVLQRMKLGGPDSNTQMATYHLFCDELDLAADWFEKALDSRDANATMVLQMEIAEGLRTSGRWPRLKMLMNLPEAATLAN
jgi:TolB-like protein/Tfp pilus assembly protein PilF